MLTESPARNSFDMKLSAIARPGEAPEPVIRAAARLLLDPNPKVHRVCAERLLSWGTSARPQLEAVAECENREARARVNRVLRLIHYSEWSTAFRDFALHGDVELEEGLLLLSRLPRPLLRVEKLREQLDVFARDLRERLISSDSESLALCFADFFAGELGISGDTETYDNPDNCHLDQILLRRRGIPVSLCALYMLVGRRLDLSIRGVGFPGHFVLCFAGPRPASVDPSTGGLLLSSRDFIRSSVSSATASTRASFSR